MRLKSDKRTVEVSEGVFKSVNVAKGTFNINPTGHTSDQLTIDTVCRALSGFLIQKNKKYGSSAFNPLRLFSKAQASDGILVRIDDKLSRIKNSEQLRKNDVVDLLGYLVLLCMAEGWTDFTDLLE